jgi:hypothetical protein
MQITVYNPQKSRPAQIQVRIKNPVNKTVVIGGT